MTANMYAPLADSELSLLSPYSKITCLVLYLYSMEIGSPQLYAEVNRVTRDMDVTYLAELGPFIIALNEITMVAERHKKSLDIIDNGYAMKGISNHIAASFLLFRGVQMTVEQIQLYTDEIGLDELHLTGSTSCSRNLDVALGFAIGDSMKPNHFPVLIVISCKNYISPDGFAMNNIAYTAYPAENEIILSDGCLVKVLGIQRDVLLNN